MHHPGIHLLGRKILITWTCSGLDRLMKPLLFLATAFINTFGITQPTPEAAERTARILAVMILGVLIAVFVVGVLVLRAIYH